MISDSAIYPGPEGALRLLRSEYLRRLARFALIDDVPAPWGCHGSIAQSTDDATADGADE